MKGHSKWLQMELWLNGGGQTEAQARAQWWRRHAASTEQCGPETSCGAQTAASQKQPANWAQTRTCQSTSNANSNAHTQTQSALIDSLWLAARILSGGPSGRSAPKASKVFQRHRNSFMARLWLCFGLFFSLCFCLCRFSFGLLMPNKLAHASDNYNKGRTDFLFLFCLSLSY